MGQKTSAQFPAVFFDQRPLVDPAIVRLVMLQAEMRDVIAQSQQKMVVGVVLRAKKNAGLLHQIAVVFPDFGRSV